MNYQCSECVRPVGSLLDANGQPELFLCPRTNRVATPIVPVRRDTAVRRDTEAAVTQPPARKWQRQEAWT